MESEMSTTTSTLGGAVWELPPLILYPFNERVAPTTLLASSKAALMLAGVLPSDDSDPDDLRRRLLAGRYAEVRMLFFLGKDVLRWVDQCQEFVGRTPDLQGCDIRTQSFAGLLTGNPPPEVQSKLIAWGVTDYASIFARGVGLNMMFSAPPPFDDLASEFLGSYHRYSDALFRCYMDSRPHRTIAPANFHFSLYASGEYSRILEAEWGES
jgi:hypothetical protein